MKSRLTNHCFKRSGFNNFSAAMHRDSDEIDNALHFTAVLPMATGTASVKRKTICFEDVYEIAEATF
jgi:hypothetical protein